ncbi:ribonuclease domain-containing protein [Brachymonas sp.]|uniref:ribonuclease domain-containing protein n=1 Tax=unclassified Brachymonas TaxID=2621329 RepID=UPI0035B3A217
MLPSGGSTIALAQLPPRGQQVYAAILGGGPYAFDKDGVIFANRERILPAHPRGYYREYTVAEPDARNRGPRRIVCGGPRQQPDACYYSADHYASFQKIEP